MPEEKNKQHTDDTDEEDALRVLQGEKPLRDMPDDELALLRGLREKSLWDDAEQAAKNTSDTDVNAAWQRMQTRMQQGEVVAKKNISSATTQNESNVIQERFSSIRQWLPLAASFAAFFVSVIVLIQVMKNEQPPVMVAAKGVSIGESVQISSNEQDAFALLGDLKRLFDIIDVQVSFRITLPASASLTEEQQRLMSQYQLPIEEKQSQPHVVIVVSE